MFINSNESPIATFRSDNYTRVSLIACLLGVLALGIFSMIYDRISLLAFGL